MMPQCEFEAREDGYCYCRRCSNRLRSDDPERCHANCRTGQPEFLTLEEATRCVHRGAVLREEPSKLCGCPQKTEAIFACSVFGECSLRNFRHGQRLAVCLRCETQSSEQGGDS